MRKNNIAFQFIVQLPCHLFDHRKLNSGQWFNMFLNLKIPLICCANKTKIHLFMDI